MTQLGEPLRSLLMAADQLRLFAEARGHQRAHLVRSARTSSALVRLIEGWCVDHAEDLAPVALGPGVRVADSTDAQILARLRQALDARLHSVSQPQTTHTSANTPTRTEVTPVGELSQVLTGDNLPGFGTLGTLLFLMACGEPLDGAKVNAHTGYLGLSGGRHVWLIYQPDRAWLRSYDAAPDIERIAESAAKRQDERHVVFAPSSTSWRPPAGAAKDTVELVRLPSCETCAQ